jgi:hypothetical protein
MSLRRKAAEDMDSASLGVSKLHLFQFATLIELLDVEYDITHTTGENAAPRTSRR